MDLNNTFPSLNSSLSTAIKDSHSTISSLQTVRFWAYLFSDILSLICYFFVIYFFLTDRTLRRALNNHIIIVLLIIGLIYELTYIPLSLYSDYNRVPLIRSNVFYSFWTFANYVLYALQIGLFAWATIERHILIFHDQWVSTSTKRFFVHYLPIAAIIVYYLIYYGLVYFGVFCVNSFEGFLAIGFHIPCAFDRTILGVWDIMFHLVTPMLIILLFSIALIARAIFRKNRLRRRLSWPRHRKMTIKLLFISAIYLVFTTPWITITVAFQYGLPQNIALIALAYTSFLSTYVIFLFPFVCCLSLPKLRKKIKENLLCCRRPRQNARTAFPVARAAAQEAEE